MSNYKITNGNLIIAHIVEMNDSVRISKTDPLYSYVHQGSNDDHFDQVVFVVTYIDFKYGFYYGITPTLTGWNNKGKSNQIVA